MINDDKDDFITPHLLTKCLRYKKHNIFWTFTLTNEYITFLIAYEEETEICSNQADRLPLNLLWPQNISSMYSEMRVESVTIHWTILSLRSHLNCPNRTFWVSSVNSPANIIRLFTSSINCGTFEWDKDSVMIKS